MVKEEFPIVSDFSNANLLDDLVKLCETIFEAKYDNEVFEVEELGEVNDTDVCISETTTDAYNEKDSAPTWWRH